MSVPDWHGAATELVASFVNLSETEQRIRVMDKLCERLDGGMYPAFLKILEIVQLCGDEDVKRLVAKTFCEALVSGRLPEGRIPAWGAEHVLTNSAFGQTRRLGPLEYVCAWYAQPGNLPALSRAEFRSITGTLLALFSSTDEVRQLYCSKLLDDSKDALDGSLSSRTRTGLGRLSEYWMEASEHESLVTRLIEDLDGSGDRLRRISSNPF